MKFIYFFGSGCSDGNSHKKDLLGGKGANLREMTNLNIPVPPGFTITTDVCRYFIDNGALPNELKEEVVSSVNKIEDIMMKKFGDANNPDFVPNKCFIKYSCPLAELDIKFERQTNNVLG